MSALKTESKFVPQGDQPRAIDSLAEGLRSGKRYQVLLGVTGSGKTFTMAKVIEEVGRKPVIGRPSLFGTTQEFLRKFGLSSLKDLPDLKSLRDENHGGPKGE